MATISDRSASPGAATGPGRASASTPADPRPASAASPGRSVWAGKIADEGITFDDVLLLPRRSGVLPADADTSTRLTRTIRLNVPLVSAPMDTVTESALAIALAQEGGIGIIHKNLSVETQAREVAKVKRSANGVITDPITLGPEDTVGRAVQLMRQHNVSGFPVTDDGASGVRTGGKVLGILTRRDLKFVENDATPVREVMTKTNLITAPPGTTLAEAEVILNRNKVEKLLLVDGQMRLCGLITMRDIERLSQFPRANVDERGRLRCGAAVGVGQIDRVGALLEAEVDVIVVDTAHGHSENVVRTVREIKARYGVQVIAGNVATAEGAKDLVAAGADAVKVGIGPGAICTTRVVTGVGVPQVTAILEAVRGVEETGEDVPVIADGGVRMSGDIAKAIAAGAHSVMMGSLFAGLDESPGELVISQGRRYKTYRGMGSEGAMNRGSADRYGQADKYDPRGAPKEKFVPEGVEGLVPYRGPLAEFAYQLVGGLRSAMGYCGCRTIEELRTQTRFCRVSGATIVENHPHDIRITKESPNYTVEHLRE
ncbi:MAG: IMP dehydrogenase [Leptolyngbya sp. PLA2]|nr:IMP dehydrogenase [Leptolyngbya sp.]MCE7972634.1 IMP dehydrogenase [Leptolyngbya sp. PL-A2]MCQ3941541.1 IMP dehydrogenase [cyanobacterium CYA1]MDL1905758.1 IMP dehydrogenase [Synechococcales cyanobacterium CNB]